MMIIRKNKLGGNKMKKFNVKQTTYSVQEQENGKVKNQLDSERVFTQYFKDKEQAKKEIDYMNRSSVNKQGVIKKYELVK